MTINNISERKTVRPMAIRSQEGKREYEFELKKQISVIRDAVGLIIKNAKYGNYHNFLEDVYRIDNAASRMSLQVSRGDVFPSRKKYGKVLTAYDGSKYSKKALLEAIDIAKEFGGDLYIINVLAIASDTPVAVAQNLTNKRLRKLNRQILEPHKARINKLLNSKIKACEREGIEVFCDVMVGKTADSILKFAKDHKIELIVIGRRGMSKFKRLLSLGSVSSKVIEYAQCPVLLVQ